MKTQKDNFLKSQKLLTEHITLNWVHTVLAKLKD